MIPIKLFISGFLSYQDPVEVDFNGLDLACISGSNGAGKSSILDAITWVLFGESRTRDDEALINSSQAVKAADVVFDFQYEGNCFRVRRIKPRGKTTDLQIFVQAPDASWRPLTEKSVRETEKRLMSTLRLDYDTFVNASFFLQGKADQFAQQNPTNRKKVLSSVLGLEVWEVYRAQAGEQRKLVEQDLRSTDGQLAEISEELAQGPARKARLAEIEERLAQLTVLRQAKEQALQALRLLAKSLEQQKQLLEVLGGRLRETQARVSRLHQESADLTGRRNELAERLAHAGEVEQGHRDWQQARIDLESWDRAADNFREIQTRRAGPLTQIASARAQLEEERRGLLQAQQAAQQDAQRLGQLRGEIPGIAEAVATLRQQLDARAAFEEATRQIQQQSADLDAENRRLLDDMNKMKDRINRLKVTEGAVCPLCGQPLSAEDREILIASLDADGHVLGDTYRANTRTVEQSKQRLRDLQADVARLTRQEDTLRQQTRRLDQLESEAQRLQAAGEAWQAGGALQLAGVEARLAGEDYASESRAELARVDAAAQELGYDTAAHDQAREREQAGRAYEQALRDLQSARAALEPLERQLAGVTAQLAIENGQLDSQSAEYSAAEQKYQSEISALPDLNQAERETFERQAEENRLRMETGMVRQLVDVLDRQREREKRLNQQRAEQARQIARFKVLERAFGKDGVPALLIEQALPEIEEQANAILDRLSAGNMSVRFVTQKALKSKKEETRETLDILISDAAGDRAYELFSGGEAFRVNFAIRMALSRVLAHRAGARLQTLFIDEGFGSQDADGRQRLLEAINQVRSEFACILVITHLEEMKEAFPARIDVEKTAQGSRVRVVR